MEFRLVRDVYMREFSHNASSIFKAKSNLDALRKVLDHCMYGFDYDDPDEMAQTEDELKESIYHMNGDGCDFIYLLENSNTGEVLIDDGDCEEYEEDWDDEEDEGVCYTEKYDYMVDEDDE